MSNRAPDVPEEEDRTRSWEDRLIHGVPGEGDPEGCAVVPPLFPSTNYRFPGVEEGVAAFQAFGRRTKGALEERAAWVYDRWDDPCSRRLEERLAFASSGRWALTFGTGMAAVSAIAAVAARPGSSVVLQEPVYGGTRELFQGHLARRLGIEVRIVSDASPDTIAGAIDRSTALVHLETPANPDLSLLDIAAVSKAVRAAGAGTSPLVTVDNTFASPFCQRPLEHGADLVVESLTKFCCGFGTAMGGLVAAREDQRELMGDLLRYRADAGGSLSPWAAWQILVYGLPTLALRLRRQQETARQLAEHLSRVGTLDVSYPGLPSHPGHEAARRQMRDPEGNFAPGGMLYFCFPGEEGRARAARFLDALARPGSTITLAASLGQIHTLVEQPSVMSHSEATGATPTAAGGVRMSVGIEPFEDLRRTVDTALESAGEG